MISVVVISLIAVSLWVTIDNIGKQIGNLGKRLEVLENKSWHPLGDFTLSPSKTKETFNTQGEAWRMSFTFNSEGKMYMGYNLRVYDADGKIIGGLSGFELNDMHDSGKGVIYIPAGQGTYSVEIRDVIDAFTFTFKVESYY